MFQSEAERVQACNLLLARLGIDPIFPSDQPCAQILRRGWSTTEHLMIRLAWDVWNGTGKASFSDIVYLFDRDNMAAICSLMQAISDSSVRQWCDTQQSMLIESGVIK